MQRFWDKWGLWFAFVIVGSIIAYGLIAGLTKPEEPASTKGAAANPAPAKAFE